MKSYKDFINLENNERTKMIFSNGFREQLIESSWKRLEKEDEVMKDQIYGTSDGLVKIVSPLHKKGKGGYWGRIMKNSHNEIKVGDVISYDFDELYVGDGEDTSRWELDGLRDDILDSIKHKTIDKINTKVKMTENSIFKDGEISSTDQLLRWLGLIVGELINRNKKEKR
jgi:hypothetical protein